MSLFNVFIERARSPAPDAAAQLAKAIGARYGIAPAEVERRLAIGRFRVKGNVDRATADSFAADLARLGAVVLISPIEDEPAAATPVVAPPVSLQQPRVAPPKPVAAPPKPKPAEQSQYSSGLAAAAAHDLEEPGLGALSGNFPLTLSMLDGADEASVSSGSRAAVPLPASFGPPPAATGRGPEPDTDGDFDVAMDDDNGLGLVDASQLPASFGPAAGVTALGGAAAAAGRGAAPSMSGPADLFAPPEANEEMQLALDVEKPARNRGATAPPPAQMAEKMSDRMAAHGLAPAPDQVAPPRAAARGEASWKTYGRDERVRFVAGVVLAAALGFVPATLVASVRERSAFAELDGALKERESQVLTRADWEGLDRVRASFTERKQAERHSIGFTSLLIWAVASGALAYVWFRVIDWDRVVASPPAGE